MIWYNIRTGSCCDFTCQATNGASNGPGASKTHERFLFEAWEKIACLVWNLAEGLTRDCLFRIQFLDSAVKEPQKLPGA